MVRLEKAEDPVGHHDKNSESLLRKYGIPLHHLDFSYIEQCKDERELEKIYHILKSGQEGYYPELLRATETRIAQIKPTSKYLRKLTPVLSKTELDKDELKKINQGIEEWLQITDKSNRELLGSHRGLPQDIPEVRKTHESSAEKENVPAKRIASTDYESWDKFDAETEMLKMDLEDEKLRKQATAMGRETRKKSIGGFTTKAEAIFEANREQEKGNECFKAGEYQGALEHYTNSITCYPNAILYTNRAITHLKMKRYQKAIADCRSALKYDPENLKANLRMAQAFQALNKLEDASVYAEKAIRIDPNNQLAQEIARKVRESNRHEPKARNVRLKIVETDGETSKPILKKKIIPIPGTSRMQPPFFKVVEENTKAAAVCKLRATFLMPLETDDEECLEQHIPVKSNWDFLEEENQICLKTSKGENYVVVDNRLSSSVKRRDSAGSFGDDNKYDIGNYFKAKARSKKLEEIEEVKESDEVTAKFVQTQSQGGKINTPRHSRVTVENSIADDMQAGGEPYIQGRSAPEVPREIHQPFTFIKTWQSVKRDGSYLGFVEIIRSLNMQRITEVIGNKIDARILSDLINCLYRHFTTADKVQKVYETLLNLCRLQRFSIAVMFLSDSDKQVVQNLTEFLTQHGRVLPEEVRAHYGLKP